ncbi:MAG TPA: VOC family protein [Longimicrobiaceae bacterium]|nr:VOC family protein [Longimicrobiaceae bacterium]
MQVMPYLNFDGQCAEAFRFYEQVLGGRIDVMQTHGESPIACEVPSDWHERILHARLVAGDLVLLGSDTPPGYHERPRGLYIALMVDDPSDAERIFHALAQGGKVTMPLERSFWAERFGMLVDRFGTPWMVNGGTVDEYVPEGAGEPRDALIA